jgi:hypothetical protein
LCDEITLIRNGNDGGKSKISIIDLTGKVIYESFGYASIQKIETSNIADGVYIIRLENQHGSNSMRFIKQ